MRLGYDASSHLCCCGAAEGGAAVLPDFGQGGRDVFVLNVPSCECLGRPSAPFGLGWISQGGEEMEQSSTHILRQFHAGFLKNGNAFFLFFFLSALEVILVSDFHRPPCPSARVGGCSRCWGCCVLPSCQTRPSSPWDRCSVFPQPLGMSSASGGEKPKGSDKEDGESSPATIRGAARQVFFSRGHV